MESIELKKHSSHVNEVKFDPEGNYILSAGFKGELFLWECGTGKCIQVYEGHRQTVNSVIWIGSGKEILSASGDGTILKHEISSSEPTDKWTDLKSGVSHMHLTFDEKYLLTSNKSNMLRVREWPEGELVAKFKGDRQHRGVIATASTAPHAIIGGVGPTILRCDVPSGEVLEQMVGHDKATMGFKFFDQDKLAISIGYDGKLIIWDMEVHHPLEKYSIGDEGYYGLAINQSRLEASIVMPYKLKRINLKDLSVDEVDLPAKGNYSIDYSPTCDQLAIGSADKTIRLFHY
ncbi:hypothetical protein MUO14_04305 [Halobacillus shinanisalinarum]|uniref:WD40 repeat domain-containing protein n=1 Tax=Halobacillus shinanisalinarum TaxID=2932258 RepID=A0ABY4H5G2_9BACI|nr:hypothetical protein [Halobacillus shinanisalinarum]UOQ94192.1 hypothetical protein MUO14_04305 [Halobacillus shinanisalinarum]